MRNRQIIESWGKVKAGSVSHDRILNRILDHYEATKKGTVTPMYDNQNLSPNALKEDKPPSRKHAHAVRFASIAAACVIIAAGLLVTRRHWMPGPNGDPSASSGGLNPSGGTGCANIKTSGDRRRYKTRPWLG